MLGKFIKLVALLFLVVLALLVLLILSALGVVPLDPRHVAAWLCSLVGGLVIVFFLAGLGFRIYMGKLAAQQGLPEDPAENRRVVENTNRAIDTDKDVN